MIEKLKVVGVEYNLEDYFKNIKLTFILDVYSENINENGCISVMFEIDASEGDFALEKNKKETLTFRKSYKPTNLCIRQSLEKENLHKYKNIMGDKKLYDAIDILLKKLQTEDVCINLELNPRLRDRLNFDFVTKHEEECSL